MYTQQDLEYMNTAFQASEAKSGGGRGPDGNYDVRIDTVECKASSEGKPMVSWKLMIDDGENAGCCYYTNNMLPIAGVDGKEDALKKLGYLKKNLKAAGVPIDDPAFNLAKFLSSELGTITDNIVNITARTKEGSENQNIYFNKLVSAAGGAPADSSAGQKKPDPFD